MAPACLCGGREGGAPLCLDSTHTRARNDTGADLVFVRVLFCFSKVKISYNLCWKQSNMEWNAVRKHSGDHLIDVKNKMFLFSSLFGQSVAQLVQAHRN